jgi:hypothetical protein
MNYGAVALVAEWLQSFKEFPPRQKPASFNLDEVMRQVSNPGPVRTNQSSSSNAATANVGAAIGFEL